MENNIEKNVDEIQENVNVEAADEAVEKDNATTPKNNFPIWIIPVAVAILIGIAMAIVFPIVFGGSDEPVYLDYTVTVVDGAGKPMSNVMVKFTTPDGETKTRITEKDGIASLKNVIEGEYKVNLEAGLSDAIVLVKEYTLTKETNSIYAVVRDSKNSIEIYGAVEDGTYASSIDAGAHIIPCTAGEMSYYLFYARTPGVYKVALTSSDEQMTLGYYGMPMFVQSNHCGDGAYDGKSFELIIQDITTPYIFGIKANENAIANLTVECTGDAPFDPNYADWIEITAKGPFTVCDTTGKTLVDVDISAESFDITLGSDGYYYTNDGKAVYIRLTTAPGHSYMDEEFNSQLVFGGSLALMAGLVEGQDVGNNIGGYVYDENGNFVNKYRYNQMIATYLDYVDNTYGVVQLNAELVECIKLHGQSSGWFDPDSYGYLFGSIEVNDDISWLFLCMVEQ
jgi:hypothetical protein